MDSSTLISFATFAMVSAFTPGPNNVMLAASGANFGFCRTLPHILGILVGFCSLVVAAGFGLATLFKMMPWLYDVLKVISVAVFGVENWQWRPFHNKRQRQTVKLRAGSQFSAG